MPLARQIIHSDQAPKAIGPYSQAMRVGDLVFMAGQIPLDPATMQMVEGDFEKESRRVFENIKAVIEEAGGTFAQVVMVRIFLTDFANFAKVNDVMQEYFKAPFPPRTTVAVAALPKNARVEIECTLHLG
jgi:reactive intermediate/imine deaminase